MTSHFAYQFVELENIDKGDGVGNGIQNFTKEGSSPNLVGPIEPKLKVNKKNNKILLQMIEFFF